MQTKSNVKGQESLASTSGSTSVGWMREKCCKALPKPAKMPTSPNEMPLDHDWDNPNWRWNVIATLNQYGCVDIHWENDEHMTAQTGEPEGQWDVSIETRFGKRFSCKHEDIEKALWYVTTLADNADSESWQKQEADRKAALEKLTLRERQMLGLAR